MPEFYGSRSICEAGLSVAGGCWSEIAGQQAGDIDAVHQTRMGWTIDLHATR